MTKNSDSGAPALSGQAGKLLDVLDGGLIINHAFAAISGGSFVDNTTEARLTGGTAFKLFTGPTATNDEFYFGMAAKFDRLTLNFGTAGVQGSAVTLAWEYWNGSAWTALTVTDGTSGLTASGTVTWTIPGSWATTAVNSVTEYWLRLRFTAGSWSTNPLVSLASITGWAREFSGTNKAVYRALTGARGYLRVDDNGPGAGTYREARIAAYETMSDVDTGTAGFPTSVSTGLGFTPGLSTRKSNTADATARNYWLFADQRTFMLFVVPGDAAPTGHYAMFLFGEFYSLVSGDNYNCIIGAMNGENSATSNCDRIETHINTTVATGRWIMRGHTGTGGFVRVATCGDGTKMSTGNTYLNGVLPYTNPADGGLYLAPLSVVDQTTAPANGIRGRFRGFWHFCHAYAGVADQDTVSGVGDLAGRTFIFFKPGASGGGTAVSVFCVETSATLETN